MRVSFDARGEANTIVVGFYICYLFLFCLIAANDVRRKMIPNSHLMALVLIRFSQMAVNLHCDFNDSNVIFQSFTLSFCVFLISFAGWKICQKRNIRLGAGDCKYMITLSFCLEKNAFLFALVICTVCIIIDQIINDRRKECALVFAPYASAAATVACTVDILSNSLFF